MAADFTICQAKIKTWSTPECDFLQINFEIWSTPNFAILIEKNKVLLTPDLEFC